MIHIGPFIELRLRESKSPTHGLQQMVSAMEMVAAVHHDGKGYCDECHRPWPCLTIRQVAWTWRAHPDYDRAWHWTVDDLPPSVVIEAPMGTLPHAMVAAQLWAQVGKLNQDRARGRIGGRDFEDAEFDLNRKLLDLVFARAEQLWPRPVAKEWMAASNEYLNGARPYDVLRDRGPAEVLAALEAVAQGAIG